jgi:hypothetical protein
MLTRMARPCVPGGVPPPTPLQLWTEAARDLLAEAREELDERAWAVFLDILLRQV